ncbi:MAG TPA: type II toxin-antitoxin system CcdA family antitoxin [Candidatus Dormibacteraeota bacterium]|nr:type II toxin-antitoxin system CcdA family antitoxin [Candidatus Dormibacteraeota bacterium]
MPTEKVSLSLDAQVVAEARAASGGNLSAYVNEALEARQRNRRLREYLDDIKPEFEPLDPEEEARVNREYDEAVEQSRAAARDLERVLHVGTPVLNEHPLVEEGVIAMGPMELPVAYVVVRDEQQPVSAVAAALRGHLEERLQTQWHVQIVIVPKDPEDRAPLVGVLPL